MFSRTALHQGGVYLAGRQAGLCIGSKENPALKQNNFLELIFTLLLFVPSWINFLEIKVDQTAAAQQGALLSVHLRLAVNMETEFIRRGLTAVKCEGLCAAILLWHTLCWKTPFYTRPSVQRAKAPRTEKTPLCSLSVYTML